MYNVRNSHDKLKDFQFATFCLLSLQYLFEQGIQKYELIVEGKLDDYTGAKIKVKININGSSSDFAGRFFTVLVYNGLQLDHVVFNLKNRYYNEKDSIFRFQLRTKSDYFNVREISGQIYITKKLPRQSAGRKLWKQNLEMLIHRAKDQKIVAWKATVTVIMLPTYPGEGLLTSEMLNEVSKEISKDIKGFTGRARFSSKPDGRRVSPGDLHRLFRMPTDKVREISKAKLFFDSVLEKVQRKVKETYASMALNIPSNSMVY